jgi:hypothetical protein
MEILEKLADFLRQRNSIDGEISNLINRPSNAGHLSEFIAAQIFGIELMPSAANKGLDGYFVGDVLSRRSVDVKYRSKQDGTLSVSDNPGADFLLVLTGPRSPAISSRGTSYPFLIEAVYLFDYHSLVSKLRQKGLKFGNAMSVSQDLWIGAEIYPNQRSKLLTLSGKQREMLALFGSKALYANSPRKE